MHHGRCSASLCARMKFCRSTMQQLFAGMISTLGVLLLAAPAIAGPPFVTDDPEPTPYRSYEIYVATDYARSSASTDITLPHLEFNYGLFPNVQVTATLPLAGSRQPGGAMQLGYGDTEFEVKARFVQETDHIPQISIAPTIVVPTGNADMNLGGGFERVCIPLWLEKGFGKYTLYGGGGFWHNPGAGNRDFRFAGVTLIRDMGRGWTVGGEVFGQTADTVDSTSSAGFNFGANRQTDEHHEILFSVGRSLHGSNTFSAYAAFGWILGPHDKPDATDKPDAGDKPGAGGKPNATDKPDAGEKPAAGARSATDGKPPDESKTVESEAVGNKTEPR